MVVPEQIFLKALRFKVALCVHTTQCELGKNNQSLKQSLLVVTVSQTNYYIYSNLFAILLLLPVLVLLNELNVILHQLYCHQFDVKLHYFFSSIGFIIKKYPSMKS